MRLVVGSTLLLVMIATLGCASSFSDPSGKHRALKIAQRRYTELVRWGEIDRASAFVDPDLQEEYLDQATKMKAIRVTDFDSNMPRYRDEDNAATVIVVYRAYSLTTFVEKEIREKQEWYRAEGLKNQWRVRPELDRIVAVTTASP
jgi:hypothetical protein